ncbi:MAG: hypothetical protein LBR83_04275 [Clostridiales bacterium]|jgi:hypothetical protein|nr:hypothetical protein [Clostridiales bacterium]
MSTAKPLLSGDFVYTPDGTEEFRNARVTLSVGENEAEVLIEPETEMSVSELGELLNDIQENLLQKAHLRQWDDYRVLLKQGGKLNVVSVKDTISVRPL